MPELPEVETVRRGLQHHVVGRIIEDVLVSHPRAVRRHVGGAMDLTRRLLGRQIVGAYRRGKYLWLTFSDPDAGPLGEALVVHLGMSGQMVVGPSSDRLAEHTRIRVGLDGELDLRFVDQRTFGGWALNQQCLVAGAVLPETVAHIARDVLDAQLDVPASVTAIRKKRSDIKRVLLDQTVVSGIGNIYADEALWRARLHGSRKANGLSRETITHVLYQARAVMTEALAAGGTSFDALYVNVNGQSGAYDRSLAVYGKTGRPCPRCATPIVRATCGGRSSFSCPRCQPTPARVAGKIG